MAAPQFPRNNFVFLRCPPPRFLQRLVVFLLLFAILAVPLAPILAEDEIIQPETAPVETQSVLLESETILNDEILAAPINPLLPIEDVNTQAPEPTSNAAQPTAEGAEAVDAPEPKDPIDTEQIDAASTASAQLGTGIDRTYAARNVPKVDMASGALAFTYPIAAPTARNVSPDLALMFNSQNTVAANMYGVGWSLNIPDISRTNVLGVDTLYTVDSFQSSMAGRLVPVGTAADGSKLFAPRQEGPGQKLRFALLNNAWTVTDGVGTVYKYGTTAAARVDHPLQATNVNRWYLQELIDPLGNSIHYQYAKPEVDNPTTSAYDPIFGGVVYPERISYVIHPADSTAGRPAPFSIDFVWSPQGINTTKYDLGFPVTISQRLETIKVSAAGRLLRQYDFRYDEQSGFNRFITAVTEVGYDAVGTATAPLTTSFQYPTPEEASGWAPSTMTGPDINFLSNPFAGFMCGTRYLRAGDLNGDGLGDVAACEMAFINNGQAWPGPQGLGTIPTGTPTGSSAELPDMTQFGDLNQDGVVDFINLKDYPNGLGQFTPSKFTLNNIPSGQGVSLDSSGPATPGASSTYPNGWYVVDDGVRSLDFNGDGLIDLVQSLSLSQWGTAPWVIARRIANTGDGPNGYGWRAVTPWTNQFAYVDLYNATAGSYPLTIAEFNGDGLPDLLRTEASNAPFLMVTKFINQGEQPVLTQTDMFVGSDGRIPAPVFVDLDGDGLDDAIGGSDIQLSDGWQQSRFASINRNSSVNQHWSPPAGWRLTSTPGYYESGWRAGTTQTTGIILDANGDGAPDLVGLAPESDGIRKVFLNKSAFARIPKTITLPSGGSMDITFTGTAQERGNDGQLLNPQLPSVTKVVKSLTWRDGFGGASTETYIYAGGVYRGRTASITDPAYNHDRSVAFASVARTRSDGVQTTTYYHQGNAVATNLNEPQDHVALTNLPYREDVRSAQGTLLRQTYTRYEVTALANAEAYGHWFVAPVSSSETHIDGGVARSTGMTSSYDSLTANNVTETNLGEVVVSSSGVMVDIGTDKVTTTKTYAQWAGGNAANFVAGTPSPYASASVMADQQGVTVSQTLARYDNLLVGQVNKGLPTMEQRWIIGNTFATTARMYDVVGNVLSETDPSGYTTTTAYDSRQLYPATRINAKGHQHLFVYDIGCGRQAQVVDANGARRHFTYDGLCRLVQEEGSDPSSMGPAVSAPLVTLRTIAYDDTLGRLSSTTTTYLSSELSQVVISYIDGLGRTIQTRSLSPNAATNPNEYVVVDTVYDAMGRVAKTSLPYFSLGAARSLPTTNTSLYSTTVYDGLDRPLSVTTSVGTTLSQYSLPWEVAVSDANGHWKVYQRDAYERLAAVIESNQGAIYQTRYAYSPAGNLIKVIDAEGNVRNFTYDGLGRRLTAEDLHAPSDGTFGVYVFTYNDSGDLLARLDPKGQKTTFIYDELHRIVNEDIAGVSGVAVVTTYDQAPLGDPGCQNGLGRVCDITTDKTTVAYAYSSAGQVIREVKTIAPQTAPFITSTAYDYAGHPVRVTTPDGASQTYIYNAAGLVAGVSHSEVETGAASGETSLASKQPRSAASLCPAPGGTLSLIVVPQTGVVSSFETTPLLSGDVNISVGGSSSGYTGFTMTVDGVVFLSFFPPWTQAVPAQTLRTGNGRLADGLHTITLWARNHWGQQVTATRVIAIRNDTASPCPNLALGAPVPPITTITFPNPTAPETSVANTLAVGWNGSALLESATLQLDSDTPWTLPANPYARHIDTRGLSNGLHTLTLITRTTLGVTTTQQVSFTVSHPDLALPTITPVGGTMNSAPLVTITPPILAAGEPPVLVYYTTDGSTPTTNALMYTEPFFLQAASTGVSTIVVRAMAVAFGYTPSSVVSAAYTVTQPDVPTTGIPGALASYVRYTPTGQPMSIIYGNGVVTSNTYDETKRYRLIRSVSLATEPTDMAALRKPKPVCPAPVQTLPLVIDTQAAYPGLQPKARPILSGLITVSLQAGAGATSLGSAMISIDGVPIAKSVKAVDGVITVVFDSAADRLVDGLHTLEAKVYDTRRNISTTVVTFGLKNSANALCPSLDLGIGAPKMTRVLLDATPSRAIKRLHGTVIFPTKFTARKMPASIEFRLDGKKTRPQVNSTGASPFLFQLDTTRLANGLHTLDMVMVDAAGKQTIGRLTMQIENVDGGNAIAYGATLRDVAYTYDRVGNMLTIIDTSDTNTAKMATYTYDDLDRLLTATVTYTRHGARSYTQQYTYSPIGNMLSQTTHQATTVKQIMYCYLGNSAPQAGCPTTANGGQLYANPHAAIKIGETMLAYDHNGNVLSVGDSGYQWTNRNELAQSTVNEETTTYTYDHKGDRLSVINNEDGGYVLYPSDAYNVTDQNKITKHMFANGEMVATIEGIGGMSILAYQQTGALKSQGVSTSVTGSLLEAVDYSPYGAPVLDDQAGSYQEQRKYIGEEYDAASGLSYLNARYYDPEQAKFLSQDPEFWVTSQEFVLDPQQQNSYSYGRNNPLRYSDPSGRWSQQALRDYSSGLLSGAADFLVGTLNFALHSTDFGNDFLESPVSATTNLVKGVGGIVSGIASDAKDLATGSAYDRGHATIGIGMLLIPESKIGKVGKATDVTADVGRASRMTSPAITNEIRGQWSKATFADVDKSIKYHYDKHIIRRDINKSVAEYTQDAKQTFSKFSDQGKPWQLKGGSVGIKIDLSSGVGGIYTKIGDIVSFWYK